MEKLDQEQSSFTSIAQIDPEQPLNVSVHQDKHLSERSLLGCVQHILSWHDMAFSEAAIRGDICLCSRGGSSADVYVY